ncbi:LysM peptidoglycan-binding domain-containing protein [Kribbella sp. NPDC059898]|uniref:LysM peptidoglycan-binding domain-containing protein n=1 Tax=Kribbella sp. NPDC059898 TaxID=3346995 RepID=UPI0036601D74
MIRALKGILAVFALAGLGWLLRWMTAGSVSGLRTYDLDSLTVLAVGTVAWIAYIWLALAVVLTVLEQVPGVVGALAGAVAGRITTKTARALLRSGLGVAAVTPLTVGVAHATPTDSAHIRHITSAEAASSLEIGNTPPQQGTYRTTEQASHLQIGNTQEAGYRTTEQASHLEISGTRQSDYRATEAASSLEITSTTDERGTTRPNTYRSTEPTSNLHIGPTQRTDTTPSQRTGSTTNHPTDSNTGQPTGADTPTPNQHPGTPSHPTTQPPGTGTRTPHQPTGTPHQPTSPGHPTPSKPTGGTGQPGGSGRVGVPDRPTDGAPTRYTELRPAVPVSVVVREGDSLWSIAARELGPSATNEAIAARWHDWYSANRHVIGNDPDLILPGQVLRTPPAPHGDRLPPHQQEQ